MYLLDLGLFVSQLISQLLVQGGQGHELELGGRRRVGPLTEGPELALEETDLLIIQGQRLLSVRGL